MTITDLSRKDILGYSSSFRWMASRSTNYWPLNWSGLSKLLEPTWMKALSEHPPLASYSSIIIWMQIFPGVAGCLKICSNSLRYTLKWTVTLTESVFREYGIWFLLNSSYVQPNRLDYVCERERKEIARRQTKNHVCNTLYHELVTHTGQQMHTHTIICLRWRQWQRRPRRRRR